MTIEPEKKLPVENSSGGREYSQEADLLTIRHFLDVHIRFAESLKDRLKVNGKSVDVITLAREFHESTFRVITAFNSASVHQPPTKQPQVEK